MRNYWLDRIERRKEAEAKKALLEKMREAISKHLRASKKNKQ